MGPRAGLNVWRREKCLANVGAPTPDHPARSLYIYYWYSALGPVWTQTRVQSGDWYGYGRLHPGQVLRGSLPLLSPIYMYTYTHTHVSEEHTASSVRVLHTPP